MVESKYITILAKHRTKLANQRTFLAYMRTGFVIAALAGSFKKLWIMGFGILMIIGSTFQYYIINDDIDSRNLKDHNKSKLFHLFPLVYIVISLGALYLQYYKK